MPYAILHTATGVVRRVTIDPNHTIGADESKIEVPSVDFSQGRPKWDGSKFVPATAQEIDTADLVPFSPEIRDIRQAAQTLINDPSVPQTVKDFVLALRVIFKQSRIGIK